MCLSVDKTTRLIYFVRKSGILFGKFVECEELDLGYLLRVAQKLLLTRQNEENINERDY